jgi:4'-phosphopantetheinyl transferase
MLKQLLFGDTSALYLVAQAQLLQHFSVSQMHSQLSEAEQLQSRQFVLASRRQEFICGRFLLRLALSLHSGKALRQHRLGLGRYAKPELSGRHGLQFNLAHCDGMLALVVCRQTAIGIDLERVSWPVAAADRRFFAGAELHWLSQLTVNERAWQQCRLWTIKEAVLKAVGVGLNCPPALIDTTQLTPDGLLPFSWAGETLNLYIDQHCADRLATSRPGQPFQLTVARLQQPAALCRIPFATMLAHSQGC